MEKRSRADSSIRRYVLGVYKKVGRNSLNCEAVARLNEFESELNAWNVELDLRVMEEGA